MKGTYRMCKPESQGFSGQPNKRPGNSIIGSQELGKIVRPEGLLGAGPGGEQFRGAGSLTEPRDWRGSRGRTQQLQLPGKRAVNSDPVSCHFRTSTPSFLVSNLCWCPSKGSGQGLSSDAIQPERNSASTRWRQLAGHLYPPTSSSWTHSPRYSSASPALRKARGLSSNPCKPMWDKSLPSQEP